MDNKSFSRRIASISAVSGIALSIVGGTVAAADETAPADRSIAYVYTTIFWSIYESPGGKVECPNGLATMGPREQFAALFPNDGKKRTLVETQLAREAEIWWPDTSPDKFPTPEAGGKIAIGLDLDGKNDSSDFTSPEGKPGIDNQIHRTLGCIKNHRTGGPLYGYETEYFKKNLTGRILIELTDVDSLINDDDVTLTTYRGLDPLVLDATATKFLPGSTQRLDLRYGKRYIHRTKGKIVNGVLTTQPMDLIQPNDGSTQELMRDARFELKLTPTIAEGLLAGYADVDSMYLSRNRKWTTHFQAYGQQAQASTYKLLKKFADAYPDPKTGENTAISGAYTVRAVQVKILRPENQISELRSAPDATQLASAAAK